MKLVPGSRLGPYEILGAVGAGGMGEVYRARDPRLGRDVALKVIAADQEHRPDRIRRFEQEARAVAALNHPHILAVHDIGSDNDTAYVVFELLEGQTLRERLDQGPIPVRNAVDYGVQLAEGLAAAHSRDVIHRDLKPSNLFLTRDGQRKILDFGLAKLRDPVSGSQADTNTASESGTVVGTAGYMAPEQARGGRADARSDIFALGAVLYEMLAGRPAFGGASSADRLSAVLHHDPPGLAAATKELVPAGLDRVVRRCLEKDNEQRFQTARDVAFAIQALADASSAAPARPDSAPKSWLPWMLATLAVCTATAGLFVALRDKPPAKPLAITQLTFRRGVVTGARFLPDGRTIVYSASWDGKPNEVFMMPLDGPDSRSLGLPSAKLLSVSSKRELALQLSKPGEVGDLRLGTLARVPLGGGVPQPILQDVVDADWSPDGTTLAAVRMVDGEQRLEYPLGKELWKSADAFYQVHCLRVSPNGDSVALLLHDLTIISRSGERRSFPLPDEGQWAIGLAWEPRGDAIWVTTRREGPGNSIWRFGLDGSQREIYKAPGNLFLHDLSPSGAVLLHHGSERMSIRAKPRGSGAERDIALYATSFAKDISEDGMRVAVYDDSTKGIFVYPLDGERPVRVSARDDGRFSSDGQWILTWKRGPGGYARLVPVGPGDARELPLDGTEVVEGFLDRSYVYWTARGPSDSGLRGYVQSLTAGQPRATTPVGVLPVGQAVDGALLARQSNGRLAWYPLDGGPARATGARMASDVALLRLSQDGRWAIVGYTESVPLRLDRMDLASGKREHWKTLAPPDLTGVSWMPQWVPMTTDGEAYAYSFQRSLLDLYLVEGLR